MRTESILSLECPVAEICGGCPLIGWSEPAELELKRASVVQALSQSKREFPEPRWVPTLARRAYRNRLRLRVDPSGRLDFFNQNKARDCSVLEPTLPPLIARLKELAFRKPELMGSFAHLEVRAADDDGRSGVCFYVRPGTRQKDAPLDPMRELGSEVLFAVSGFDPPDRVPFQRRMLTEDVFCYLPLDAFVQVNSSVNRALCATLRALARAHRVESSLDLYAGSGNFALPLAKDGGSLAAVEARPSAAAALCRAAEHQGLFSIEVATGDCPTASQNFLDRGRAWDLVVIDAPRAGVRVGLENMGRLARRHMALVSCNPETLARDAGLLARSGFELEQLLLFDMFARTRHVEVLAWLSRR